MTSLLSHRQIVAGIIFALAAHIGVFTLALT
jgi:hypothetical protein